MVGKNSEQEDAKLCDGNVAHSTLAMMNHPTDEVRQLIDKSTQFSFGFMENIMDSLVTPMNQ